MSKLDDLYRKALKEATRDEGYSIEHQEFTNERGTTYTVVRAYSAENDHVGTLEARHSKDGALVGHVNVSPGHRRKGLASAMYQVAERLTGKKFRPNPVQTPMGERLWAGRKDSFG